jgi:hypothetical protein
MGWSREGSLVTPPSFAWQRYQRRCTACDSVQGSGRNLVGVSAMLGRAVRCGAVRCSVVYYTPPQGRCLTTCVRSTRESQATRRPTRRSTIRPAKHPRPCARDATSTYRSRSYIPSRRDELLAALRRANAHLPSTSTTPHLIMANR